jgi:hypothetical protein
VAQPTDECVAHAKAKLEVRRQLRRQKQQQCRLCVQKMRWRLEKKHDEKMKPGEAWGAPNASAIVGRRSIILDSPAPSF